MSKRPCAYCGEELPPGTNNPDGSAMHHECRGVKLGWRMDPHCGFCGKKMVSSGRMHAKCRAAYEELMADTVCICGGEQTIEVFWCGQQCARCGRAFLADLQPELAPKAVAA